MQNNQISVYFLNCTNDSGAQTLPCNKILKRQSSHNIPRIAGSFDADSFSGDSIGPSFFIFFCGTGSSLGFGDGLFNVTGLGGFGMSNTVGSTSNGGFFNSLSLVAL